MPITRSIVAGAEVEQSRTERIVTGKSPIGRTVVAPESVTPVFGFVNLQLHEVECVQTTKEVDRDEIVLASIKIEGEVDSANGKSRVKGKANKGEQVPVGQFQRGDRKSFKAPKILARFPSGGAHAEWPRYFVAMLLMIEKDEGAIGAVVNSAINSVEKELTLAISTAVATGATSFLAGTAAGAAVGSAVPLVGTAIGAAAGTAVGLALGEIKKSRADDVLETEHLQLRLESFPRQAGEISGSRETRVFKGFKGIYKVTFSWAVS